MTIDTNMIRSSLSSCHFYGYGWSHIQDISLDLTSIHITIMQRLDQVLPIVSMDLVPVMRRTRNCVFSKINRLNSSLKPGKENSNSQQNERCACYQLQHDTVTHSPPLS